MNKAAISMLLVVAVAIGLILPSLAAGAAAPNATESPLEMLLETINEINLKVTQVLDQVSAEEPDSAGPQLHKATITHTLEKFFYAPGNPLDPGYYPGFVLRVGANQDFVVKAVYMTTIDASPAQVTLLAGPELRMITPISAGEEILHSIYPVPYPPSMNFARNSELMSLYGSIQPLVLGGTEFQISLGPRFLSNGVVDGDWDGSETVEFVVVVETSVDAEVSSRIIEYGKNGEILER
jgi:hypothetical protein